MIAVMINLKILYEYMRMYWATILSFLVEDSKKDFSNLLNLYGLSNFTSLGSLKSLNSLVTMVFETVPASSKSNGKVEMKSMRKLKEKMYFLAIFL